MAFARRVRGADLLAARVDSREATPPRVFFPSDSLSGGMALALERLDLS